MRIGSHPETRGQAFTNRCETRGFSLSWIRMVRLEGATHERTLRGLGLVHDQVTAAGKAATWPWWLSTTILRQLARNLQHCFSRMTARRIVTMDDAERQMLADLRHVLSASSQDAARLGARGLRPAARTNDARRVAVDRHARSALCVAASAVRADRAHRHDARRGASGAARRGGGDSPAGPHAHRADASGTAYAQRYHTALQDHPDAVVAHGQVAAVLKQVEERRRRTD